MRRAPKEPSAQHRAMAVEIVKALDEIPNASRARRVHRVACGLRAIGEIVEGYPAVYDAAERLARVKVPRDGMDHPLVGPSLDLAIALRYCRAPRKNVP